MLKRVSESDILWLIGLGSGFMALMLISLTPVFDSDGMALAALCCFCLYVFIGFFISATRKANNAKGE